MQVPIQDIIDRIETNKIFIGDPDNLSSTIANLAMRLEVTDLIKAQALEIRELQLAVCKVRANCNT